MLSGVRVVAAALTVASEFNIIVFPLAIAPDAVAVNSGAALIDVHVALAPLPPEVNT